MKKRIPILLTVLIISVGTVVFFKTGVPENNKLVSATEQDSKINPSEMLTIKDINQQNQLLPIKEIPTLEAYLKSQSDQRVELERVQYEWLSNSSDNPLLLLKYGCGNKQCSTLLVKQDNSGLHSLALAEGIFQDYEISSDGQQMMMRYGYNEGNQVIRHVLIVIDLKEMKIIPFESQQYADTFMYAPTWPIETYDWIDTYSFFIDIPDIESNEFEEIQNWRLTGGEKTKRLEIMLNPSERLDTLYTP